MLPPGAQLEKLAGERANFRRGGIQLAELTKVCCLIQCVRNKQYDLYRSSKTGNQAIEYTSQTPTRRHGI